MVFHGERSELRSQYAVSSKRSENFDQADHGAGRGESRFISARIHCVVMNLKIAVKRTDFLFFFPSIDDDPDGDFSGILTVMQGGLDRVGWEYVLGKWGKGNGGEVRCWSLRSEDQVSLGLGDGGTPDWLFHLLEGRFLDWLAVRWMDGWMDE